VADDGKQALQSIAAGTVRPDLILLDLAMPHLSGPAFLQALDAIEGGEDIEVIVITGVSDDEIHVDVRARALRLLHKPFRPAEVRAVVAHARRSHAAV
jgi:DNA-binding response OmpR family regulator